MSYSESVKQKYFEVEAKCGHVGRMNCVWVRFAVVAESRKDADPYLHCKSKREQNQIEGFSARIEPDEFNIAKRQKKSTKNAEYKLRKSRCAEYDAKRKIFEYYSIA